MSLPEILRTATRNADGLRATVPPTWLQGRTSYGGLSAALALETARDLVPDAPPLRSAQISFVGPLSGEVSVTVAAVYPNGTMLVQGQKRVTLNRGDEFVQIKGIVRPADIDANNRVPSTRVADARIAYTGKGDVARAGRQGWLSRFFQAVSPF